jgi:NAD+ kinase
VEAHVRPERIAVVVHPTRKLDRTLESLKRWTGANGLELVQVMAPAPVEREVAPAAAPEAGDLMVALGGDGTVLSALRAGAAVGAPVLGVACGSVGVLATVTDGELDSALARVMEGDWTARRLPALAIESAAGSDWAVNDFVAVRRGPGQLVCNVTVDDELYVRMAGDGLVVATPLGSSAYSMAAGGPLVVHGTPAFVCTPVAMHGGNAPPLIVPATSALRVQLYPGFAGYDIEIDGHDDAEPAVDYTITLVEDKVTLVSMTGLSLGLTRLREKHLISDSARILARDARGD